MINIKKSLAPTFTFEYNDKKIEETIRNDFFVLCYICEEYVPIHFQIDHFYPQNNFSELKNDWNNLFYCCAKCNGLRPKSINTKGNEVLNNCEDDVEELIHLKYHKGRVTVIANSEDEKTVNTRKLLNRIYNGIGSQSKAFIYRRNEIKEEIEEFDEIIKKYKKNNSLFENELSKRLSKRTMSKKSAYISFKRQFIRDEHKRRLPSGLSGESKRNLPDR